MLSEADVEYNAFEYDKENHAGLEEKINNQGKGTLYKEDDIIPQEFDAVLLINTLHEIPIESWAKTFLKIKNMLKNDGHLFFCETVPLITGEFINNTGFLVLGLDEQNLLFNVENIPLGEKGKLNFSDVQRDNIPKLSLEQLKEVLEKLRSNSFDKRKDEIQKREDELRTAKNEFRVSRKGNARNAAYYAVQNLNAQKGLEMLKMLKFFESINIDVAENKAINPVFNEEERGDFKEYEFGGMEWLIVNEEKEEVVLLSKYIIAHSQFHSEIVEEFYFDSFLYKYLNEIFYNQFCDNDKEAIQDREDRSENKNEKKFTYNIFLLRKKEVDDYLKNPIDRIVKGKDGTPVSWWLEPDFDKTLKEIPYVSETGDFKFEAHPETNKLGIRPALYLKKSSILTEKEDEFLNERELLVK